MCILSLLPCVKCAPRLLGNRIRQVRKRDTSSFTEMCLLYSSITVTSFHLYGLKIHREKTQIRKHVTVCYDVPPTQLDAALGGGAPPRPAGPSEG
jgi:hypothetical protein